MVSAGQTQYDDTRNMSIRANLNDDSQFANKIAKERIWTLTSLNNKIVKERIWINPVTSKIMKQPLESDTDARLHEERVISVRKQAESASRVSRGKRPR